VDPIEARLYLARRLHEVRGIRRRARGIERELTEALSDAGAGLPMNPLRLEAWIEGRQRQIEHVEVELLVFACRPRVPWWRRLWPW
jgi:hypothetical protein